MSPLDDLRIDSDAAPLHRATRDAPDRRGRQARRERGERSEARTGWIVAALSFFGVLAAAGVYWWTTEQGPTQTPVRDAATESAVVPPTVAAPAPVAQTPAPPPPPPVAQAATPAPSPKPSPAPAPASRVATAAPVAPHVDPEAARRAAAPERARRASAGEGSATPGGPARAMAESDPSSAWPPAGRDATNTSAPNYSDAGPPVVAGPGPRYQAAPAAAADPNAPAMPAVVGGDPGPPRAAGPGPRYDDGSRVARPRQ